MIYFNRFAASPGTDVNESNESKECDIFHHWYFLDKCFRC